MQASSSTPLGVQGRTRATIVSSAIASEATARADSSKARTCASVSE
jgi:hypothetical protein